MPVTIEIVSTDIKQYEAGGFKLAIAQAEVTDLLQLAEHLAPLAKALDELKDKRGLDFAMLLVTDIVRGTSRLIVSSNAPPILGDLPYPPLADGTRVPADLLTRRRVELDRGAEQRVVSFYHMTARSDIPRQVPAVGQVVPPFPVHPEVHHPILHVFRLVPGDRQPGRHSVSRSSRTSR